jgi:hypothetical protein
MYQMILSNTNKNQNNKFKSEVKALYDAYSRRGPSGTTHDIQNISLGRTDCTVRAQNVSYCLSLSHAFNARYIVKYPFFARFLTPLGARTPLMY